MHAYTQAQGLNMESSSFALAPHYSVWICSVWSNYCAWRQIVFFFFSVSSIQHKTLRLWNKKLQITNKLRRAATFGLLNQTSNKQDESQRGSVSSDLELPADCFTDWTWPEWKRVPFQKAHTWNLFIQCINYVQSSNTSCDVKRYCMLLLLLLSTKPVKMCTYWMEHLIPQH